MATKLQALTQDQFNRWLQNQWEETAKTVAARPKEKALEDKMPKQPAPIERDHAYAVFERLYAQGYKEEALEIWKNYQSYSN